MERFFWRNVDLILGAIAIVVLLWILMLGGCSVRGRVDGAVHANGTGVTFQIGIEPDLPARAASRD